MTENAIGQRVRVLRESRQMTREEFAGALGVSTDWVKKFETGQRQADPQLSVLRAIAHALGLTPAALLEDETPRRQPSGAGADTALLRAALLAPMAGPVRQVSLHEIWRECEHGFASFQAGNYTTLLASLPTLITTAKTLPDDPANARAAYRAHHLAATTLMKYGGGTAAWHAAERALEYARTSRDPVATALAAQTLVYAMTSIGEAHTGTSTALDYAGALESDLSDGTVPASTALGMLYLKGAVAAAACGQARTAHEMLQRAEAHAENIPPGTNHLATGFDSLNVRLYRISIDAALARYTTAARGADTITLTALRTLPRERRTHHLIEAADIYSRIHRTEDALTALLEAETDSPREITRPAPRAVIETLLHAPGPVHDRLRALAHRAGIEA